MKRARVKGDALSPGAVVKVIDDGKCYPSYETMVQLDRRHSDVSWALARKLKLARWVREDDEDDDEDGDVDDKWRTFLLKTGDVGIVLDMARETLPDSKLIVGIYVESHGRDFLVSSDGLEVLVRSLSQSSPSTPSVIMQQLWDTHDVTGDVSLVAESGEVVRAHRNVLAVASPVLAAAFTSGMKEATMGQVELSDTTAPVIQGVLKFLYTGHAPVYLDSMQVWTFAHKYQVIELARYVAPLIVAAMTPENAADTVRMLRDFDSKEGAASSPFVDAVIDLWYDDRDMMREILRRL